MKRQAEAVVPTPSCRRAEPIRRATFSSLHRPYPRHQPRSPRRAGSSFAPSMQHPPNHHPSRHPQQCLRSRKGILTPCRPRRWVPPSSGASELPRPTASLAYPPSSQVPLVDIPAMASHARSTTPQPGDDLVTTREMSLYGLERSTTPQPGDDARDVVVRTRAVVRIVVRKRGVAAP